MTFLDVLQEISKNPNLVFTRIEENDNLDDKCCIYHNMIFKNKNRTLTTADIYSTNWINCTGKSVKQVIEESLKLRNK